MKLVYILLLATLPISCLSKEEDNNEINLNPTPIKIDPKLRRALLRALRELENEDNTEAIDEVHTTEAAPVTSNKEQQQQEEEEESPSSTTISPPHSIIVHSFDANNSPIISTSLSPPLFTDSPQATAKTPLSTSSSTQFPDFGSSTTEKPTTAFKSYVIVQKSEGVTHPPVHSIIDLNSRSNVQQDIITSATNDFRAQNQNQNLNAQEDIRTFAKLKNTATSPNAINVTPKPISRTDISKITFTTSKPFTTTEESSAKVEEVQFFPAPLVAAFTVHQDEQGLPRSVVPIFRDKNTPTTSSITTTTTKLPASVVNDARIKQQQQDRLLREERLRQEQLQIQQERLRQQQQQQDNYRLQLALQEKQRLLEEQFYRLQQQQKQQDLLLKQQQQFQEQQLQLQRQRLAEEQQRLLRSQQTFSNTASNVNVNAQQSQSQQLNQQPVAVQANQPRPNNGVSSSVISITPSISINPNLNNNNANVNNNNNFLQQNQQPPVKNSIDFLTPPFSQTLLPPFQTTKQVPFNDFSQNTTPLPQSNRVFRQESGVGNFGLNNNNNNNNNNINNNNGFTRNTFFNQQPSIQTINDNNQNRVFFRYNNNFGPQQLPQQQQLQQQQIQQQQIQQQQRFQDSRFFANTSPKTVDTALQNLLYNSGITRGREQEDLSIVSKVLSLNHFGRNDLLFGASSHSQQVVPAPKTIQKKSDDLKKV